MASNKEFHNELEEAKRDPKFMKEINAFIKVAEGTYSLQ